MKKVSIVVPVYNVSQYLNRCINSLLKQSYKNIEIILVNDGSTDNSKEICEEYFHKYDNIILINKKNGGLSSARNAGIKKATGYYICFVDSDDYVSESFISDFVVAIERDLSDIAMCKFERVNEHTRSHDNNNDNSDSTITISGFEGIKELLNFYQKDGVTNHVTTKIFKRDFFENIKFPEGRNFEDIGVCFLLFEKSKKISIMNKRNYYYFKRSDSITSSMSLKSIEDKFHLGEIRSKYIQEKYPELQEKNVEYQIHNYLYLMKEIIKKEGRLAKNNDLFNEIIIKYRKIKDIKKLTLKEKVFYYIIATNSSLLYDLIKQK